MCVPCERGDLIQVLPPGRLCTAPDCWPGFDHVYRSSVGIRDRYRVDVVQLFAPGLARESSMGNLTRRHKQQKSKLILQVRYK